MAAACGLFHNLGSFAFVRSSTHASQMGSSEFLAIINTGHLGPSGGRFSGVVMVLLSIQLHGVMVRGGGVGKLDTFCVWGKCVGPTPVARNHGQEFNMALLNP